MKIKSIKIIPLLALFLASPLLAQAQAEFIDPALVISGPRFFVCIVAGVLLAIGFQTLLTMLSVASGISAIGNIHDKAHEASHSGSDSRKRHHSSSTDDETSMATKISSAFGIWTMATVTISLFFASLLAVKLSLVGANFIGITLGLVIWAAFFTTMMYLEMKAVSSLVGGIVNIAMAGIRKSAGAVGGVFGSSSESEAKSVAKVSAQENAKAMRQELQKLFSRNDVDQKINHYVNKLKPQDINIKQIKEEFKDLLDDIEIKEKRELGEEGVTKHMFLDIASKNPSISKKDVKKLSKVFDQVKGIATSGGSRQQKVEKAVEQFTPASQDDIEKYKQTVVDYLKATDKQELQPDKMREDIQAILKDPSKARSILQHKASAVDRDTIINVLTQRGDISREDAEKYAGYAEKALDFVKSNLGLKSGGSDGKDEAYSRTRIVQAPVGTVEIMESHAGSSLHQGDTGASKGGKAKERLQDFLSSLQDKKEFNINRIKQDFTNLFSGAGDDHESLSYKLKHYNEDEMMRFVTNNTSIPPEKAHSIVGPAIEARDSVLAKAEEVEREIRMRLDQAKEEALVQAENTRKAAASAAWWLVGTAVVSGIASAVGGMLALESWMF